MGKNTYGGQKAHGGGVSVPSRNAPSKKKKSAMGKVVGASKAPLPPNKNATGSGIAGRGTSAAR